MGLLTGLLLLPVTGPLRGLLFVFQQIKERVDAEQLDERIVERDLVTLSLRRDLGEVSEAEYLAAEAALLERLNAIRAYKESLAEPEGAPADGEDGEI
ncbi:MAG: gas vesicle protein GvpG [Chloroflexi bacterium]|nr:gas vesicle protein GvpG [Chloroflexota bacterium]MBI4507675.1 gas vesicle protein GvpG [Chloroflexota bacterium]